MKFNTVNAIHTCTCCCTNGSSPFYVCTLSLMDVVAASAHTMLALFLMDMVAASAHTKLALSLMDVVAASAHTMLALHHHVEMLVRNL